MPPARLDLRLDLLELLRRARDQQRDPAGGGDLQRRRLADAARGAGDHDGLAVDGARERAVLVEVRVEVALPVVPQLLGVALQRRHLDAGALQRALRVAPVEARHQRHVLDHGVGDPEVGQQRAPDVLQRGQLHRVREHALREHVGHPLVDAQHHLRRVAGAGERVEHVAGPLRARVDEVERLPVEAGLVRDVVDRRGDPVDRHDVRPADLEADQREPLRQRVARLLHRLEEVVRPVDLVHLAGARVADHDRRPVDAPGARDACPHELLGLELGLVVRRGQLLALVEHVLGEVALVAAGDGDRGAVVEDPRLQVVGEVDRVLRAADVEQRVLRLVGGHVVDRGEVEEVVDLAAQRVAHGGVDAQQRLGEVAGDGVDAAGRRPAARPALRASRPTLRGRARGCRPRARAAARPDGGR